jgi:DNA polymerase-3 subunit delta
MLRLDDPEISGEAQAAAALGITGSTFPARKALAQGQRLGSAGVARAVTLLAEADLDLKGRIEWSAEAVLEVLVARLCQLAAKPPGQLAARPPGRPPRRP